MVFISIVSIVVAITGLIVSLPTHASNRRAAREANLRSAWMTFARDSATLDRAYAKSAPGGLQPLSVSHSRFGGLLGCSGWVYSGGSLKKLDDAIAEEVVVSEGVAYDDWVTPELRKAALLPYRSWDLLSNLRVVTGEGPQWSSKVFAVKSVEGGYNDGFSVKLYQGEFYDFFNTSVGMGVLAAYRHSSKGCVDGALLRLRNRIWGINSDRMSNSVDIRGYFALATLACLTVVVSDKGAHMLVHRRGNEVADNRMMVGPVPSGSHSTFLDADDPVRFIDTLKREFAEELLDVDETGESPRRRTVDEAVEGLVGRDNTYLLGVGFYPVQGYLSVLTMCVIDERSASVKSWKARRKIASVADAFTANYEGTILEIPFEASEIDVIRRLHRRTPCLGEIACIIGDHFDEIKNQIMQARE